MMDEGTDWDQRDVATTPTIAGRKLAFVSSMSLFACLNGGPFQASVRG